MELPERLAEERKRLRLTQEALGELGGVTKKTQLGYEKGISSPTADYLQRIAMAGVDVVFVLTGRTPTVVEAPPANYTYDLAVQQVAPQPQEPTSLNRDALRSAVLQVLAENQSGRSARTVGDTVDAIVEAYDRFRAIIGSPIGGALGNSRHPGTGTEG